MPSLNFSPRAINDLGRLRDFLNGNNIAVARRAVQKILSSLKDLENNPEMGKQIENRSDEYRELAIPFGRNGYIAAYRYTDGELMILGIWHQRENRELKTR